MRAIVVTAQFTEIGPDTRREIAHFARALGGVDGLLSTNWLESSSSIALVQTFESHAAVRAYLSGPLFESLGAIPTCRDVFVQQYGVATGLNALTVLGSRASVAVAEGSREPEAARA